MGSRIYDQEVGKHTDTKQNTEARRNRGTVGDRSNNLVNLIGAKRVSQRNFKYEGTYYITEDGEICSQEYVKTQKPQRTGVSFYEVADWTYNERKQLFEPTIRRIVIVKKNNTQLPLNL
nr:MAG TPA: hypothetical protein [Microviridae sp.]